MVYGHVCFFNLWNESRAFPHRIFTYRQVLVMQKQNYFHALCLGLPVLKEFEWLETWIPEIDQKRWCFKDRKEMAVELSLDLKKAIFLSVPVHYTLHYYLSCSSFISTWKNIYIINKAKVNTKVEQNTVNTHCYRG